MKPKLTLVLILYLCTSILSGCSPAEDKEYIGYKIDPETKGEETENENLTSSIPFAMNENMTPARFSKKVDGDTAYFVIDTDENNETEIKVRFLAVDTPETVKQGVEVQEWGPEASDFTTEKLENAREIYLEWDDNSDRQDAYDRYLAWVWIDGQLLEELLVEQGLAEVAYIYDDYKYVDQLYAVQNEAKDQGIGIWSEENKEE